MNATGIPAPAPTAPVTAASAATPLTQQAGDDFVGMLMQLIGGSAVSSTVAPAVKLATTETTSDDTEDLEAIAAMLAMPLPALPAMLPWAAQPAAATNAGVDPLELLGLGGTGTGSSDSLLDLKTELVDTLPAMPEIDADNGNGVGSLSPVNETQQARAPNAESTAARTLHSPVGTDRWANELGNRLTLMVDRNQQAVSLRLSPEHLGPLEVRISITDDKASVWFGATHADTRAAIENALPRLREMFTAQGLSLADAGVFREPPRDQQPAPPLNGGGGSEDAGQEPDVRISTRGIGLLDAYA